MNIGYARVSTGEQPLDLPMGALAKAGCEKVSSGTKAHRPVLADLLGYVRAGDTLVVWRLDRLGHSLPHLIETLNDLANREIGFNSLTEQIDTTIPGGKLVFHVLGALAEFKRDLTRERTHAGRGAGTGADRRPAEGLDRSQASGACPGALRRRPDRRRHHLPHPRNLPRYPL